MAYQGGSKGMKKSDESLPTIHYLKLADEAADIRRELREELDALTSRWSRGGLRIGLSLAAGMAGFYVTKKVMGGLFSSKPTPPEPAKTPAIPKKKAHTRSPKQWRKTLRYLQGTAIGKKVSEKLIDSATKKILGSRTVSLPFLGKGQGLLALMRTLGLGGKERLLLSLLVAFYPVVVRLVRERTAFRRNGGSKKSPPQGD